MSQQQDAEKGEQVGTATVVAELRQDIPIYEEDNATDIFERGRAWINVGGANHEVVETEYFDDDQ